MLLTALPRPAAAAMATCTNCGRSPAPSGKHGFKYCKVRACQDVGIAAGHITNPAANKHPRVGSPARSDAVTQVWSPAVGQLTSIEKVLGCRCVLRSNSRPSPVNPPCLTAAIVCRSVRVCVCV